MAIPSPPFFLPGKAWGSQISWLAWLPVRRVAKWHSVERRIFEMLAVHVVLGLQESCFASGVRVYRNQ